MIIATLSSLWLQAITSDPVCQTYVYENSEFTVCPFDHERHHLELIWQANDGQPVRSFPTLRNLLGTEAAHLRFAMNAGMFDSGGRPIGLYVEDGYEWVAINRREGPGNFHLLPNGVFWLNQVGVPMVTQTDLFDPEALQPLWATQSGPMILIEGRLHPQLSHDGQSRYVRNAVGVDANRLAYFVISEAPVSFGRLARFMRDDLGVKDALSLDGAVSSLWWPEGERMDVRALLGPLAVITRSD